MKFLKIALVLAVYTTFSIFTIWQTYRLLNNFKEKRNYLIIIVDKIHASNVNIYTSCIFGSDIVFVGGVGFIYVKGNSSNIFLYDKLENVKISVISKDKGFETISKAFHKDNMIKKISKVDSSGFYSIYRNINI